MMKTRLIKTALISLGLTTALSVSASQDLSQKSWEEIVAQAKQEGSVTFSVWYLQPQFRLFVKDFEKTYGIKVKIPEGTLDGNMNKLIAEKSLAKGKMDVIAIAADNYPIVQKNDVLRNLNSLPNFAQANHALQGVKFGNQAMGFWGNQTGFAYDPLRVSEDQLPQSWQETVNYMQTHPKKFGYADPNGGASGKAFIFQALLNISGNYDYQNTPFDAAQTEKWQSTWDWFNQNKQNMVRTASNADSLTRLNDGELDIVSAWQDHLFSLQKQGAVTPRLKFYVPKFGMPGGGNVVVVAQNAPHPAASLVFTNWLVSPETQQKLADHFGIRQLNAEVGEADIPFFPLDWSKAAIADFTKEVIAK